MRRPPFPIVLAAALLLGDAARLALVRPDDRAAVEALRALRTEHDPRRMSARELRRIPGVGTRLARALAEARDGHVGPGPLRLEDVRGIGEARAASVRAWGRAHGFEPGPLVPARGYAAAMRTAPSWLAPALAVLVAGCGGASAPTSGPRAAETDGDGSDAEAGTRARTLTLAGGALHALEAGPESGPTVLLLHGARFEADTWEQLGTLAVLARAGWRAVALDWPGYGATPRWGEEPDPAVLLEAVARELGAAPVVVGPSMGGGFALAWLATPGARARALVGVAPAGAHDLEPADPELPVLLVWGSNDAVVPLAVGEALAARLPRARLEVLDGASHPCYLDEPERFHALLLGFLASLPPPGR